MSEIKYLISDTSKKLGVEPHVLRYWEEELDMPIKRNEMGHRYYTEDDIRVLTNVRDMKEQGFQLKAIKHILHELYTNADYSPNALMGSTGNPNIQTTGNGTEQVDDIGEGNENIPVVTKESGQTPVSMMSAELKMEQFQEIMFQIIVKALEKNNGSLSGVISSEVSDRVSETVSGVVSERVSASVSERLSEDVSAKVSESVSDKVSGQVSDRVIKQMDYILRENEEREEERFRKLDEAIRQRQKANAEAAAALMEDGRKKKKRHGFGKKEKGRSRIFG